MRPDIKTKKPYEGFIRRILVEDILEGDPISPYDILDDLGQAYIMTQTAQEIRQSKFEGKQVYPTFFRVASFPVVRKEDLVYLKGLEKYVKTSAREAVAKQEDGRLITLISSAITDYSDSPEHVVTPNHIVQIGEGCPIEQFHLSDVLTRIRLHEIDPYWVLANPVEAEELRNNTDLGGLELIESVMVPQGSTFITPEKHFLGVMPTLYQLGEVETSPSELEKGWVIDELVGMLILNPRGLAAIKKESPHNKE